MSEGADRGVRSPARLLPRGLRVFASPPGEPRSRRTTDLVLLVAALLGLAVTIARYPPSGFERSLERFLTGLPGWLDPVFGFLVDLGWLLALGLLVAAAVRRRLVVLLQALVALALALGLGLVSVRLALGDWAHAGDAVLGTSASPRFPSVRLAEAAAVILSVSPHVVRPLRTVGRWVLVLAAIGAATSGAATPYGTVAALLIGIAAACIARLAFGTSAGRPGLRDIELALTELGVPFRALEVAERQVAGVFHVHGTSEDGQPLLVKVYGRDAHDTQLVASLWRTIWYQGGGDPLRLGRLGAAEHEALATLLARGAGVPTQDVVTAAATVDDDAVLVLRGAAEPVGPLPAGEEGDARLREAWAALARLDRATIAHRQIEPAALALVDGHVGLVGLGRATLAPREAHLLTDRAQLLLTLAVLAGQERALDSAAGSLGADGLAALLPYLQVAALSPGLRRELKAAGVDADDFRARAAERAGVEPPEPVQLRRVTWWSAAQLALLGLAAYTIAEAASNVSWDDVLSSVRDASIGWLVAALVVAQLPRLTQALTTLGSIPVPLPFGPVYTMQLAMGYMNVALPSNLARMAINIRFFQRQGVSAPVSVAAGAIDSFAGTVVQALLLGLLLVFSESSLAIDLPMPSGGSRTLLLLALAIVVASVLVLVLVRRLRTAIVEAVRRWWPDVRAALAGLRSSNKLGLLVFGSVGTEVLFAVALGLFARGFGYDVSLAELLVINISVSLLASFVPVPGGVGVAEFGLTVGLTSAGLTPEAAIACVLLYRIATFYLPPTWGFAAMQWLKRNRYL